jgi:hypothetical protein
MQATGTAATTRTAVLDVLQQEPSMPFFLYNFTELSLQKIKV